MRTFYILLFLTALSTVTNAVAQEKKKKALFVIVDGIPADVVEKIATPNLDALSKEGSYLRAFVGGEKDSYSQTPTISAVGYNSLLTGTWANKHNVWDNSVEKPNYHYWNIFRLFKNQYPHKTTAIFSSWLDNRTKLIGEGLPQAGALNLDYKFDGYELDTINFPHDKDRLFMHKIDEAVTDAAANCIREKAPDLSWVYLEYTDDMGHLYGDSPEFYAAVEKMDAQIGRIWNAIHYRKKQFGEDWLIFVTTDHGRDEKTGRDHGGHSPRQRSTWMVTNYKNLNSYARHTTPGVVDIMPTIARFLKIDIDRERARELDGTPLIGPVSVADLKINQIQNLLDITWQSFGGKGTAKIWLALTNHFKDGGKDEYKLVAEVPLSQKHYLLDVSHMPSRFYKVVVEGPDHSINKWVVK